MSKQVDDAMAAFPPARDPSAPPPEPDREPVSLEQALSIFTDPIQRAAAMPTVEPSSVAKPYKRGVRAGAYRRLRKAVIRELVAGHGKAEASVAKRLVTLASQELDDQVAARDQIAAMTLLFNRVEGAPIQQTNISVEQSADPAQILEEAQRIMGLQVVSFQQPTEVENQSQDQKQIEDGKNAQ